MNRSIRDITLFEDPIDYGTFRRIFVRGLGQVPVGVLAYCVMPNHWHLVLRCATSGDLSRLMHWVSTTHARAWHHRRGSTGRGPVYKGRFLSVPLEEAGDVIRVCRYVERNPLKAGLVDRAELWQWSSLADRRSPESIVPLIEVPALQGPGWVQHVNQSGQQLIDDTTPGMDELDDDCEPQHAVEIRFPVHVTICESKADEPHTVAGEPPLNQIMRRDTLLP